MVSTTALVFAAAVVQLATLPTCWAACVPLGSPLLYPSPCAPSVYPSPCAPCAPCAPAPLVLRDNSVANGLVDAMQLLVASDLLQNNLAPCLPLCAPLSPLSPLSPLPTCCPHLPACPHVSPYAPYYPYYL